MPHRQRVNAGARLSKQWPGGLWTIQDQSKGGCWTAASLDTGSCGGTAGEAQVCVVLLAAHGGLPRRRTTSRLTGGNGQGGIRWPGFSRDAEQQTANDWPAAHGARWTMRHGWVPMLGRSWMPSWVSADHGAMRCAKQRLGRRRSQRRRRWWMVEVSDTNRRLALIGRGEKRNRTYALGAHCSRRAGAVEAGNTLRCLRPQAACCGACTPYYSIGRLSTNRASAVSN